MKEIITLLKSARRTVVSAIVVSCIILSSVGISYSADTVDNNEQTNPEINTIECSGMVNIAKAIHSASSCYRGILVSAKNDLKKQAIATDEQKQAERGLPERTVVIHELEADECDLEPAVEEEPAPVVVINTTDITKPSGLTADQLNTLINNVLTKMGKKSSQLYNQGQALYNMEQNHGTNALLALAVASWESGWGTSKVAWNKNNLFGIYGKGTSRSFSTVGECIDYFGKLMATKYFPKGRTSISSIGKIYCTTPTWASKIQYTYSVYKDAVNYI